MSIQNIIWDFNGTIINDLPLSFNCINTVLKRRNLSPLRTFDDYRSVFCMPIIKYYEKIGLDFSKEPYKVPADEWIELYQSSLDTIPMVDGIKETLDIINSKNISQFVLSASEKILLKSQLDYYGLSEYFEEILGADDAYGKGKIEIAEKWAQNNHISLADSIYVGDTSHDFETAKALGCKCVLFSGGHMSKERLSAYGVPVIDKIIDLIDLI